MKFMIAENRASMRRLSFHDGRIVVERIRKGGLTDDQRKLVAGAHLDPLEKLNRIEAAIKSGKIDAKALEAILSEKPDFDALVAEGSA